MSQITRCALIIKNSKKLLFFSINIILSFCLYTKLGYKEEPQPHMVQPQNLRRTHVSNPHRNATPAERLKKRFDQEQCESRQQRTSRKCFLYWLFSANIPAVCIEIIVKYTHRPLRRYTVPVPRRYPYGPPRQQPVPSCPRSPHTLAAPEGRTSWDEFIGFFLRRWTAQVLPINAAQEEARRQSSMEPQPP
jgi:hypothetical protein